MSDTSTQNSAKSASTETFVTALVFNAIVFGAEIAAFTILRPYFKAIYEPRSLNFIAKKRVQSLGAGLLTWPIAVFKSDYRDIQRINGMDAYFFVRFLRMMVRVLLPIWIISWAVLMPVTSVGTAAPGQSGLNRFAFGNVQTSEENRYWAHLVLTYVFTIWIWYNIKYEMRHFVVTRQQHLIDPVHSASVQANTVLVTGIPTRYLSEGALHQMFSHLPGGVKTVWINRDLKELPDLYDRRNAACSKLESAETALLHTAAKIRAKELKKAAKAAKKAGEAEPTSPAHLTSPDSDVERDTSLAAKLVPASKRPTHRLPLGFMPFSLPLIGKEVDSIDWAKEEIRVTTQLLDEGRAKIEREREVEAVRRKNKLGGVIEKVPVVGGLVRKATKEESPFSTSAEPGAGDGRESQRSSSELRRAEPVKKTDKDEVAGSSTSVPADQKDEPSLSYPPLNSAFLTFYKQTAAHLAVQSLAHHEPYRMAQRYIEVAPEDVIWGNLGLNPYEAKLRMVISYAATAGLIILWAIPVAFIGIISNIHSLCAQYSWLAWICTLPSVVVGIISGILPPVLLAVLMMLLPIILRLLARFEGIPQRTGLELSLMSRYFMFLVVHSFLIVTISSGIIAALPNLVSNPTGIPSILAQKLPQASIFFLTYIILQGLSGAAGGFLQIVTLIVYYVKLVLLGSTPRSIYNIKYGPRTVAWGTLFPDITLLVVITFGYSIISPIINGLSCFSFFLFYLLYKYLFTWVLDQPPSSDTGGMFFPKALQHMFVGLYVQQVCLCALFFLAQNQNGKQGAIPEGALMVVLIIFTVFFQMLINNSYGPLIRYLPMSLADRTYDSTERASTQQEREPLLLDGTEKGKGVDEQGASPNAKSVYYSPVDEQRRNGDDLQPEDHGINQGEPIDHMDRKVDPAARKPVETKDYGFAQPAASRPQPIVWFPHDTLGLGQEEEATLREAGVEASMEGAEMDAKGNVDISAPPPGMEQSN